VILFTPRQLYLLDMADTNSRHASENGSAQLTTAWVAHRRWLRTVVLARLGDAHAADEVLQEVAVAASRQHAPMPDAGQASAWLYRVALRQALLYRRKRGRETRRVACLAERRGRDGEQTATPDPLRWLLADEEAQLVRAALDRLPPRDRELLLLKYTEDWSCREIAQRLGVTVSTVQTRLQRARQRLRRQLARLDLQEEGE